MTINELDVELFAARVRLHFSPELRETAFEVAYAIARVAGPKVKSLTPETTLDQILDWVKGEWPVPSDSLDLVEWVMAIEEEAGPAFKIPDELASRLDRATFRELVEYRARRRAA